MRLPGATSRTSCNVRRLGFVASSESPPIACETTVHTQKHTHTHTHTAPKCDTTHYLRTIHAISLSIYFYLRARDIFLPKPRLTLRVIVTAATATAAAAAVVAVVVVVVDAGCEQHLSPLTVSNRVATSCWHAAASAPFANR